MTVLITREAGMARRTAARLGRQGIDTLVAPLMVVEPVGDGEIPVDGVDAVLFSSQHGVTHGAGRLAARDKDVFALDVFVLGPATATAARDAGFTHVHPAAGDAAALFDTLHDLAPHARRLLHLSGAVVSPALTHVLAEYQATVERHVVYRARALDTLPAVAAKALREETVTAVLFYSRRSVTIFEAALNTTGLVPAARRLAAHCLSPAIAEKASDVAEWRDIVTADRPTEAALVETLTRGN